MANLCAEVACSTNDLMRKKGRLQRFRVQEFVNSIQISNPIFESLVDTKGIRSALVYHLFDILRSKVSSYEEFVAVLAHVTFWVYNQQKQFSFEQQKRLKAFLIHCMEHSSQLSDTHWSLSSVSEDNNPAVSWCTSFSWCAIQHLYIEFGKSSKTSIASSNSELKLNANSSPFANLTSDFEKFANTASLPPMEISWEQVYHSSTPHSIILPAKLHEKCTPVDRLLLTAALRPDALSLAFADVLISLLDLEVLKNKSSKILSWSPSSDFSEKIHFSHVVQHYTKSCQPILLAHSPNTLTNTTYEDVKRLGGRLYGGTGVGQLLNEHVSPSVLSFDQSEKSCRDYLKSSFQKGLWIIISYNDLYTIPGLSSALSFFFSKYLVNDKSTINSKFRCFITGPSKIDYDHRTNSSPEIAHIFTMAFTVNVKNLSNLGEIFCSALEDQSQTFCIKDDCTALQLLYSKNMFKITLFHTIIVGRQRYALHLSNFRINEQQIFDIETSLWHWCSCILSFRKLNAKNTTLPASSSQIDEQMMKQYISTKILQDIYYDETSSKYNNFVAMRACLDECLSLDLETSLISDNLHKHMIEVFNQLRKGNSLDTVGLLLEKIANFTSGPMSFGLKADADYIRNIQALPYIIYTSSNQQQKPQQSYVSQVGWRQHVIKGAIENCNIVLAEMECGIFVNWLHQPINVEKIQESIIPLLSTESNQKSNLNRTEINVSVDFVLLKNISQYLKLVQRIFSDTNWIKNLSSMSLENVYLDEMSLIIDFSNNMIPTAWFKDNVCYKTSLSLLKFIINLKARLVYITKWIETRLAQNNFAIHDISLIWDVWDIWHGNFISKF